MADDKVISVRIRALTADLESGMRRAGASIRSMQGGADRDLKQLGQTMTSAGRRMTLGLSVPIAAGFAFAARESIKFESAMAGVAKTVDLSEAEFEAMSQGIRDMAKELPASREEIAGVAEAAGQLGISKDHLLDFTRTMIDLGESTNLSAEEASTALAQFANITQMPQTEFENLGSTIVALGNVGASTEADIVAMAQRLAAAGTQAGLSEADILGVANAMSSLGIEAEAGGTAISQTFIKMTDAVTMGGDKLDTFAQTAGMTADEFGRLFEQDPAQAFTAFVEGLDRITASGQSITPVLDQLGLSGIRVRDALGRAAGGGDLLRESLELGSSAWEENSALADEAARRYETTGARMEMAWNQITDAAMTVGDTIVPILALVAGGAADLAGAFDQLPGPLRTAAIALAAIAAVAGPLVYMAGGLISAWALVGPTMATAGAAIAGAAQSLALWAMYNPVLAAVGAAAVVAAGALALFSGGSEEAGASAEEASVQITNLQNAIISQSGATGTATRRMLADMLAASEAGGDVARAMADAGLTINDLEQALLGGEGAFREFWNSLPATGDEFQGIANLKDDLLELAGTWGSIDPDVMSDIMGEASSAVDETTASAERLDATWKGLNNTLTDFDAVTNAARAAMDLRDSFAAANEEGGIDPDEMLGLRDNLSQVVQAYRDLAEQQNTNRRGVTDEVAANRQLRRDLGQMAAFIPGELRPQWRALTRDILRVPDRQRTTPETPGMPGAQQRWRTLDTILAGMPASVTTSAVAYVDAAIASWNRLKDSIVAAATAANTSPAALGFTGSMSPGPRANGGPVEAGMVYTVGERGPETFVPRVSGTIYPHSPAHLAATPIPRSAEVHNHFIFAKGLDDAMRLVPAESRRKGREHLSGRR